MLLQKSLLVLTLLCTVPARAQDPDLDMMAARDAARAADAGKLEKLAPRLAGHVLEPYVEYWRFKLALGESNPDAVLGFLARHQDDVLGDRLRGDWLKSLGLRHEWTLFAAEYPRLQNEDTELTCYALQYRRQLTDEVLAEARPLWFAPGLTPLSCAPLFDELFARGELRVDDVWQRFRLATEAGNLDVAQWLNSALDEKQRIAAKPLERATRDPEWSLTKGAPRLATRAERELVMFALTREARLDPVLAYQHLRAWQDRLPADDLGYARVQIAFQGARKLLPEALGWYRELGGAALNDLQLAWKARAALRAQSWPDVEAAIAAMSLTAQQDAPWRYWKARALAAQGHAKEAAPLFAALAPEPQYYGLLAAEELGRTNRQRFDAVQVDPAALAEFGRRDSVRRALKLFELDMRAEGVREWVWTVRNLDDAQLLTAAEFALRQGLYDRAINTADKTVLLHDYNLRYPAPYRDVFDAASRAQGLDEAFVFGLVRQESRFVAEAMSGAGAVGLMQLMPPTAKWVAKKMGRSGYRPSQIGMVDVNVQFGTYYLRHVLDRLDGLPALAAAAYNAGPGRAQAWRASAPLEGAIYVESIPFNETRDYVKKVLANAMYYAQVLGGPQLTLKQRLGVVTPRGAGGYDEDLALKETMP
jgi:soluble lytic murein transglycosylase